MLAFLLCIIAAGAVLAWKNWRWGICVAILIGLLQDPLRKLLPGTPAILTLASIPVWIAVAAGAAKANRDFLVQFLRQFPRLHIWLQRFALYLLIPAALSFTYGRGSWQITLLGAFVYGFGFLMMVLGWQFPLSRLTVAVLLGFYVVCASIALVGGPLEHLGWDARWRTLGTTALGHIWVTHRTGTAVYMLSGFFRGPDVMGWHAVMVFMFAAIMALCSRGKMRWMWIAAAIWGLLSLWLCGRRKMLAMIPVFLGCYTLLIYRFRSARRLVSTLGLLLLLIGSGLHLAGRAYPESPVGDFYLTVFDEWEQQVVGHGVLSIITTVRQAGFWGYGLGMGQQGTHNIAVEKPRLWQESGPSKVVAELGIPGAILLLIVGFVLFRTAFEIVRMGRSDRDVYLSAGLFSVLIANLASAVVSAQVYGDPFIALFLSMILGVQLSLCRFGEAEDG